MYLTGIYSADASITKLKADINSLFNVKDGKVKANWVTDSLWVPVGKAIYVHDIMTPVYKAEMHIFMLHGHITSNKKIEYPITMEPLFDRKPDSLKKFIGENINWSKIPNLGSEIKKIGVTFSTGPSNKPENIKIQRATNDTLYDNEAKRVISLLSWGVYLHGKIFKETWILPVVFSEAERLKYAH